MYSMMADGNAEGNKKKLKSKNKSNPNAVHQEETADHPLGANGPANLGIEGEVAFAPVQNPQSNETGNEQPRNVALSGRSTSENAQANNVSARLAQAAPQNQPEEEEERMYMHSFSNNFSSKHLNLFFIFVFSRWSQIRTWRFHLLQCPRW